MGAQTHIGAKFFISDDPANEDLDDDATTGFPSLDYTEVVGIVNMDNTGVQQNAVSQSTWDRPVLQKGKGEANAGDPTLTVNRPANPGDGYNALAAAAEFDNTNRYAMKVEYPDGVEEYNRGLVMGPEVTKGSNEDFRNAIFQLAFEQAPVFVNPTP